MTAPSSCTAQAKWLRLLQPLLIEFLGEPETRERGQALAGQVLPVLLSNLGHPYKVGGVGGRGGGSLTMRTQRPWPGGLSAFRRCLYMMPRVLQVCRADIARTLFIIFSYGRTPLVGPLTGGVHAVDHARAVALVEGDAEVRRRRGG